MFLLRPGVWHDDPSRAGISSARPAAGLKVLVPGYAQWYWRQRERALVLFGSFVMALGVGALTWGTWTGVVVVLFAFGTHVVSVVDVVRQSAFPGFGRWMPVASASGGLAVGVYAPALVVASFIAWPVMPGDTAPDGYLVNCWAYRGGTPKPGDWVWMRSSPWGEPHLGRVVAVPGQEVEWAAEQFRVDGEVVDERALYRSSLPPEELAYKVPTGHILVHPGATLQTPTSHRALVLISQEQIKGRVWARSYPIWERQILH